MQRYNGLHASSTPLSGRESTESVHLVSETSKISPLWSRSHLSASFALSGKVGRGRALHGAHQWESAEGSVLPCVHPREGPFPAERTRETSVPAEPRVCGGTCSHALLLRQVSPAHAPSRLRHLGDRRSAPETERPGYLYFSASPCCHAFLETKLSAISERGSNSFLIQGIPWATSFGCRLYLTFTESI